MVMLNGMPNIEHIYIMFDAGLLLHLNKYHWKKH